MTSTTSISDALDHMEVCPGGLESWRMFKKNSKLQSCAPGRSVYAALSVPVYTANATQNRVSIPECLEPIPKRFLLRLFTAADYRVSVFCNDGTVRKAVDDELNAPIPPPEISPVKQPQTRKRLSSEVNKESIKSHKKNKKAKKSA